MIDAVLFDMGGVLIGLQNARGLPNSRFDWRGRQAMLRLLHDAGGRIEERDLDRLLFDRWREEYEKRYLRGAEASWEPHLARLRAWAKVDLDDLDLLSAWFRPYGEQLICLSGAVETLKAIREQGLRTGLVSNVPMPGVLYHAILAGHGLAEWIETFHFSYDEGSRKPSPAMVRHALAALGVEAERAVMVGDRRDSDVAAGRAAGVGTVWLRREDGGGPDPDLTIDAINELPALVESLG